MLHLPNQRRSLPILLAASMALIAAACTPAASGAVLGDHVWQDANGNGLQDPGEPGAAGVTVSLYGEDAALVASTSTDELGAYEFAGLASGRYFLTFVALQDNRFTLDNAGDDEADSDADPSTGKTAVFDFNSSQSDLTWDVGLMLNEPGSTPEPPPPPEPATPAPTPVVPQTGGKYRFTVTFVRVSGDCGLPDRFVDTVEWDISAADQTTTGQTTIVSQPSTGDVNIGQTQPNGEGQASSERESYTYTLEFVLDETGKAVRVIVTGLNTYTDLQGCVTEYEIEGEAEVQDE
jgi:hypothetical protein